MREGLVTLVGTIEVHLNFFEKVPENLEIPWDFHDISFATMMEYKPALDVKAPRARLSQAGVDSDSNLPKHEVPLEVQIRVTQGPYVQQSWSRCLTLLNIWSLWVPIYQGVIYIPRWREEIFHLEMDAYLDDFKTSIFLGSQRRSVEPIPSHRGPSILSWKGPRKPRDFLRFSWNFSCHNGGI